MGFFSLLHYTDYLNRSHVEVYVQMGKRIRKTPGEKSKVCCGEEEKETEVNKDENGIVVCLSELCRAKIAD